MTVYTKIMKKIQGRYLETLSQTTLPEGYQNTNMNLNIIEWFKFQGK